jgi:hypothetical protein
MVSAPVVPVSVSSAEATLLVTDTGALAIGAMVSIKLASAPASALS